MAQNELIIEEFKKLIKQVEAEKLNAQIENDKKEEIKHEFRLRQIKRSLAVIKKYPKVIKSSKDLEGLAGVGKGTMARIDEIIGTGKLDELKKKYSKGKQATISSLQELELVYGIGPKKAKELVVKYGILSVDDLKKAHKKGEIELNRDIILGLKYHGVYKENIPRAEVKQINKLLKKEAAKVHPLLETTICGSYRRGRDTSNDIDVLLTHPNIEKRKQIGDEGEPDYLRLFVDRLIKDKFIIDSLTDKDYTTMYRGFCKFDDNPPRRIDIRMIPYESYYPAILYFTGPDELNRAMRQQAIRRGMLLNEYGLYKIGDGKKKKVKINSEEDIFDELGMKYLSPKEREKFYTKK